MSNLENWFAMGQTDCFIIGHYSLSVNKQIQLAEMAFGKNSSYYFDALEKKFVSYRNRKYTSSQLYNLFYTEEIGDLSFDHVTFQHSFSTAVSTLATYLPGKVFPLISSIHSTRGEKRCRRFYKERTSSPLRFPRRSIFQPFPLPT